MLREYKLCLLYTSIKGGSLATLPDDVTSMFKTYDKDASLASWALRYVGTLPGVKVILSGCLLYTSRCV